MMTLRLDSAPFFPEAPENRGEKGSPMKIIVISAFSALMLSGCIVGTAVDAAATVVGTAADVTFGAAETAVDIVD